MTGREKPNRANEDQLMMKEEEEFDGTIKREKNDLTGLSKTLSPLLSQTLSLISLTLSHLHEGFKSFFLFVSFSFSISFLNLSLSLSLSLI